MHEQLRDSLTFWDGVRTASGVVLIGGIDALDQETPHTAVVLLQGSRRAVWTLEWKARLILSDPDPNGPAWIIGLEGETCSVNGNGPQEHPSIDIRSRPDKFGRLLGGCTSADALLVVGYRNQVAARSVGSNRWEVMDQGLPGKVGDTPRVFGLEAIDTCGTRWYAAGLHGALHVRVGGRWREIASPTNVRLMAIHCADDGMVYACGQFGTVLSGTSDQWEIALEIEGQPSLWDIASLGSDLYVSSFDVLYRLSNGECYPVDFSAYELVPSKVPTTFFRLSKREGALLSVGSKDILELSEGVWKRII